jgi:hypothetical protein
MTTEQASILLFVTLLAAFCAGCQVGIVFARTHPKKKVRNASR